MTLSKMPASAAMRMISRASRTVVAMGFSTCMCLPASAQICTAGWRKSGIGTQVDDIHLGMPAYFLVSGHKLCAVLRSKSATGFLGTIGANSNPKSDVLIRLCVLVRNCSRPNKSDSHKIVTMFQIDNSFQLLNYTRGALRGVLTFMIQASGITSPDKPGVLPR